MLCDLCGENEAVLFIEQTNANNKRKLNLCVECARKNGVSPDSKSIGRSLAMLFDSLLGKNKVQNQKEDNRVCPVCGSSVKEITMTRHAGCPECYAVFKSEAQDSFKKIGVIPPYKGTLPKRLKNFRSVLTDRIIIQAKLEESLKREDYEKAAVYRDYLKALEKSPVSGGEE
ncbi:UvrB/UvrC motif-containing protein [Treponema sp. UBA3813]|uniref:UvrB/UvrC motif-containing protein n=1 Tax=Treponema sp. UBA3813 TaxID=1947715 RepID=UPI0025EFC90C|nr:UvrB/UvrC motif-containing protein [Treponema sp. UBA3813]